MATAQAAVAVRPVLRQVVAEVVASEAFKGVFHAGVQEMHASVVQGHRRQLLVRRGRRQEPRQGRAAVVNPGVANAIPDQALAVAVGISQSRWAELFMRGADLAGWLIVPSALAAVLCFTAAARRAPRPAARPRGRRRVPGRCRRRDLRRARRTPERGRPTSVRTRRSARALGPCSGAPCTCSTSRARSLIVLGAVIALAASLAGGSSVRQRWDDARAAWRGRRWPTPARRPSRPSPPSSAAWSAWSGRPAMAELLVRAAASASSSSARSGSSTSSAPRPGFGARAAPRRCPRHPTPAGARRDDRRGDVLARPAPRRHVLRPRRASAAASTA